MTKLTILAAAALVTSLAASPVLAKDASHHADKQKTMKVHKAGKQAKAQQRRNDRFADDDRGFERRADFAPGYDRPYRYDQSYDNSGFWPADIAAGAVGTAGAIASTPFRDSYAYDPGFENSYAYTPAPVYRSTFNDNWTGAWNDNWAGQSYAQRNGFVCTPGTWFTNSAGYLQICQ